MSQPEFQSRSSSHLPPEDDLRRILHNEVHARPSAKIRLPALVVFLAVFNHGVSRQQECEHLSRLPGHEHLTTEDLQGNFLRLHLQGCTLKWERHTEFTRYSLVHPLPPEVCLGSAAPEWLAHLAVPDGWLAQVPGRTFCAIKLAMVHGDVSQPLVGLGQTREWFTGDPVVASLMGNTAHSLVATDFQSIFQFRYEPEV